MIAFLRCSRPTFYEVRPRSDHRGVDLISDALPFAFMMKQAT
jgi:hypothetical protein